MAYSLTSTCLKISVSIVVPILAFSQMQDELLAYPYAKMKEALAIEHDIVGTNYAFVVEKLGFPDRTRVKNPTVLKTTTREIANKNERIKLSTTTFLLRSMSLADSSYSSTKTEILRAID